MLKLYSADSQPAEPERKRFWLTSFWNARQKNLSLADPVDQARSEFDEKARTELES